MFQCKICNSATSKINDMKKNLDYYRCQNCGFIYLNDACMVDKKREKAHYDKHENSFESLGYVEMFEKFIAKAIEPYFETIESALEFGCGSGPVLAELLKRRGLTVEQYDLYYFPKKVYEEKQYDLITSTEVFEHLQNPLSVLTTLVKSLNNNGYIILMTQFPSANDKEFLDWWYRRDITHISFFTPKSFEIMAEKVGLKVIKTIKPNIVVFQKC
jgi:cyclopropane fatty-acyl-phospholipid synthase-like methyltransferase